jgi:PqqD family protein of HPr-rel-A system
LATNPASEFDRWRRSPECQLSWVCYDDEYVVYHRPSGRTHFLNFATYRLLAHILTSPVSLDEVTEAFTSSSKPADESLIRDELGLTLKHLEALGLVERA